MNWNYRLFDVSDQNGGDPYFTVREVYYGADGEPIGWAKATLGDETVEGCRKQLERILEDIKGWSLGQPVLKADDIRVPAGAHADEEDVCVACGEAAPQGRDYCERYPNCFVAESAKLAQYMAYRKATEVDNFFGTFKEFIAKKEEGK